VVKLYICHFCIHLLCKIFFGCDIAHHQDWMATQGMIFLTQAVGDMNGVQANATEANKYNNLDHYFSLMAEDIVLSHYPHMSPHNSGDPLLKSQTCDWTLTKSQLEKLGFRPSSKDPWDLIGLTRLVGPNPTTSEINNRLRCGRQVAKMGALDDTTLGTEALSFLDQLQNAAQACVLALPDVLRERKKLGKSTLNWRWMEASLDFVAYMCAMFGTVGWKSALFMSNVHDVDLCQFGASIVQPEHAMQLYKKLQGSGPVVMQALKLMASEDEKLILWAPSETPKLLTLLAEILKLVQAGTHRVDMRLVIPYNPLPHCDTPSLIQELWTCPLLPRKYMPLMKGITFYTQPLKCVFTGSVGPLHHFKSLAMFHVSNFNRLPGHIESPQVLSWKSNLIDADMGNMIYVDLPMQQVYDVNMILHELCLRGLTGWEYARRSNAHTSSAPRQVLCGYFDPRQANEIDITLTVSLLKDKLRCGNIFVGSSFLFTDETSFLVEFGEVSTLDRYRDLCQEILVVSNKKAVITTIHPKEVWEPRLTSDMIAFPLSAISSIRFRNALGLQNNLWVKPAITNTQLEAGRQQALLCKKSVDEQSRQIKQVQLKVEGLPQVRHDQLCTELMDKVSEVSGIRLAKSSSPAPGVHEWVPCYRGDGSFSQQMTLHLQNEDEIASLIQAVHGSGVRVGGINMSVEIRTLKATDASAGMLARNFVTPGAASAGMLARNFVTPGAGADADPVQVQAATAPKPNPDVEMGGGELVSRAMAAGLDLRGFVGSGGGGARL
jgi:hypothetical protein